MGYSCTARASLVMDAVRAILDRDIPGNRLSNKLPNGFYEIGREQADGAITGTVWKTVRKYTDEERAAEAAKMGQSIRPEWVGDPCRKAGSFKVSAEGWIVRFPQLTKAQKAEAEAKGAAEYTRVYERV